MGQGEVLDYLKKHPMQWFSARQLMNTTNIKCVTSSLSKLKSWYPEIETRRKELHTEYRYNPKPRKSFKKLREEQNKWKENTMNWNL